MVRIVTMRVFFLLALCFSLSGCAQRLDELETRLTDVDERVRIVEDQKGLPVGSDRELLEGRRLADVRSQMSALRNEVLILKGKVEALEFENEAYDQRNKQILAELERAREKFADLETQGIGRANPQQIYRQALRFHQEGDFDRSRAIFIDFIEKYPQHPLGDNAIFWVGESYFSEKDYRKALVRFQDLVEKFPDSDKKCDAMDRQVKAFEALGMTQEAESYADLRTQECRNQNQNQAQ